MPWTEGEALTPTNLNTVGTGTALFSVTDPSYGARGDGVTDDASAIQAAITAAKAVGGTVYFPSPTSDYRIASRLVIDTPGVTLQGVGSGKDFSGTVIRLSSAATDAILVTANNTEISNIRLVGPGRSTTTSRGIVLDNQTSGTIFNLRLHNLNISSFGSDGIYTARPELLTLHHVISQANGGRGLFLDGQFFTISVVLNSCRFINNDGPYQAHIKQAVTTTAINSQFLGTSVSSNQTMCFLDATDHYTDISGDYEFGKAAVQVTGSGHAFIGTNVYAVATGFYVQNTAANPCYFTGIRAADSAVTKLFNFVANSSGVVGPIANGAATADTVDSTASVTYLTATAARLPDGAAKLPSFAFTSEQSLGFYRSTTSTIAQSYGTFVAPAIAASTYSSTGPGGAVDFKATNNGALRSNNTTSGASYFFDVGNLTIRDGDGSLTNGTLSLFAGSQGKPGLAFTSEQSLGIYSSAASTIALSYGTLNLNGAILSSLRTTNASGTSATVNDGEFRVVAVSATSAELAYRSGNTTYRFIAAATAL